MQGCYSVNTLAMAAVQLIPWLQAHFFPGYTVRHSTGSVAGNVKETFILIHSFQVMGFCGLRLGLVLWMPCGTFTLQRLYFLMRTDMLRLAVAFQPLNDVKALFTIFLVNLVKGNLNIDVTANLLYNRFTVLNGDRYSSVCRDEILGFQIHIICNSGFLCLLQILKRFASA